MYKIMKRKVLNSQVVLMEILAPEIAKKARPGQFIIFRIDERGERVPLTIADFDREKGTVTIIYQLVGKTTTALAQLSEGDFILDFVGPLGVPSPLEGIKRAAVIGGGLGTAIAFPQAKGLAALGARVDVIAGFRNKDLIILQDELEKASDKLIIMTDDGSNGNRGFVTQALEKMIQQGRDYDAVIAVGPLVMMRAVSELTRPYKIKTIVSMNATMVDGTGMCGCCRVTVGGETRFACVDGPDFDGHLVNFDEAIKRSSMYQEQEAETHKNHKCKMEGMGNG